MKNTIKVLGIIAIVAIIGFSFAACGGDDDSNNTGGNNTGGNNTGGDDLRVRIVYEGNAVTSITLNSAGEYADLHGNYFAEWASPPSGTWTNSYCTIKWYKNGAIVDSGTPLRIQKAGATLPSGVSPGTVVASGDTIKLEITATGEDNPDSGKSGSTQISVIVQ
jgi:hypothetical protein